MDYELAKSKAINYIGISKKTEQEVKNKLLKLNFNDDIIEKTVEFLKDLDYINDERYVDAYLRKNVRLLKYSIYEIIQKLLTKGINKDIIDKSLEIVEECNYEKKVVAGMLKSKLKNTEVLKQKQYLYRRGFKEASISIIDDDKEW